MKLLILTEGTQTEIIYFKALIEHYALREVSVSPDPLRLMREAMKLKEQNNCPAWVVLDTEIAGQDRTRDRRMKKALADGARLDVQFAVSEPCFEAWLLAHFDGTKNYNLKKGSRFYADLLSKKLGTPYRKGEYDISPFLKEENLQSAICSPAGKRGLAKLTKTLCDSAPLR
ncbi:RloB family protein [Verrucomicrobiota bacterium]